jgi:hypothetical protein
MIVEILCLLLVFIAGIAFFARCGFFHKFLPKSLIQKIYAELSSLKVSAPNLKSTSDSNNSVAR